MKGPKRVAQGTPNAEPKFALDYFKVDAPRVITSADTDTVVLVDHNEAAQSVDNLAKMWQLPVFMTIKLPLQIQRRFTSGAKPWGSSCNDFVLRIQATQFDIPTEIAGFVGFSN